MISFKQLQEKKTKVKINPNLKDVMEKSSCDCECDTHESHDKCGDDCNCNSVSEAKKKDDTYLETDFKKRLKNNEKARKELMKGPQMKNPHLESYDSQEEVSEESTEESTENSILTFNNFQEATRLKKEKGYDKGGTKKPSPVMQAVIAKIEKEHGKGSIAGRTQQKKKVKGAKSTEGTGKYKKRADDKKAYAAKAKKAGFKSAQSYTDTMARYGGESNYKKGKGLGT
jgi:hypothetical protein|tara:strand:- start:470 stop:1153 length:684 start_codon:yes stop_codon:yes gene_type:complete